MTKRFIYVLSMIALLTGTRCADPLSKIELNESKIVTRCFISPQDTVLIAFVSLSTPFEYDGIHTYYGDTIKQVKDAIVMLSDQTHSVQMVFQEATIDLREAGTYILQKGGYTVSASQFPIIAGQTYTVTVRKDDKIATAYCKIPEKAAAIDFQYQNKKMPLSETNPSGFQWKSEYTIKWKDFTGGGDFYRAYFIEHSTGRVPGTNITETFYDTPLFNVALDQTLFNDHIEDGGKYEFKGLFYYDVYDTPPWMPITDISAFVLHVDRNYYEYHRSIGDQIKTNGNPFYEPILIYTNFDGGLGVFAGYNMTKNTLPFVY